MRDCHEPVEDDFGVVHESPQRFRRFGPSDALPKIRAPLDVFEDALQLDYVAAEFMVAEGANDLPDRLHATILTACNRAPPHLNAFNKFNFLNMENFQKIKEYRF